jgi:hypothetical protein
VLQVCCMLHVFVGGGGERGTLQPSCRGLLCTAALAAMRRHSLSFAVAPLQGVLVWGVLTQVEPPWWLHERVRQLLLHTVVCWVLCHNEAHCFSLCDMHSSSL